VSGVFNDFADFVVLGLWNMDDFFNHKNFRWLPDSVFTNMVLQFDLNGNGQVQGIESPKNPWIAWDSLSYILNDAPGTSGNIKLWDHATLQAGSFTVASATWTLTSSLLPLPGDYLTFYYRDIIFQYVATGGETLASIVANLMGQINNFNWTAEGPPQALIASNPSGSDLEIKVARYGVVNTSATGNTVTFSSGIKFPGIATGSTLYINNVPYVVAGITSPMVLNLTTSPGNQTGVSYLAEYGGDDGNMITIECRNSHTTLATSGAALFGSWYQNNIQLSGGSSNVTWRISIDFTTLSIDNPRMLWLTFAPRLANGVAYAPANFDIQCTNWTITDPSSHRALKVPNPSKSTRIESRNAGAVKSGTGWVLQSGFYSGGYAYGSSTTNDKFTIIYNNQFSHDLWIGSGLYVDRGIIGVKIDGGSEILIDTYLNTGSEVVTARLVQAGLTAGQHTIVIRVTGTKNASSSGYKCYFDYLLAAFPDDVQDPLVVYTDVSCRNQSWHVRPLSATLVLDSATPRDGRADG